MIPTALAAARAIDDGTLTCEALIRACLERIEEREGELHAWSYVAAEAALAQARALDRHSGGGPLKGIPIGVKDIIDTDDMPTSYGSQIYAGHRPARDASCVALARSAGAIILGKTVTTEFAYYSPGPTGNPHNPAHTPGGSSSGSAAAVAAGMVPLAFGTQTAGSVIRPAAFCGCVGYKPSFGLLDLTGIRPIAASLDTLGVLAGTVSDAAFLVSILAGRPTLRVEAVRPRIGFCRPPDWAVAEPAMQARMEDVADLLRRAGSPMTELQLPPLFEQLGEAQKTIMAFEAARSNHPEIRSHANSVSQQMHSLVETGMSINAGRYDAAKGQSAAGLAAIKEVMADIDVLLTLAAPGAAPAGLSATGDPVFNRIWTLLGLPCIGLPCGKDRQGLPLAVQLVGRPMADQQLLASATWIEQALVAQWQGTDGRAMS